MEALLDSKGMVEPAFWNWKRFTWATVLFITSVALVELWSTKSAIKEQDPTAAVAVVAENESHSLNKEFNDSENAENLIQAETPVEKKDASIVGNQVVASKQKSNQRTVVINQREERSDKEKHFAADKLNSESGVIDSEVKVENNTTMIVSEPANTTVLMKESTSGKSTDDVANSEIEKDSVSVSLEETVVSDSVKKETPEKEEEKPIQNDQSFSLKLAVSPDYSSVGYFTPGATGFNYGLIAEYGFNKHVSVSLGGIWSKKLYTYESIESAYGSMIINGRKIDGDCRILYVPLNMNYYFNPGHQFTVYASLGLSSYIMFSEDYKYDVVKNGSSYDYTTHVERKNNEWFRMTNISLGLQYRLRKRLALQIEPFVKAPLTGIGEGDYKLVSSGAFFNVKYTFK